MTFPIQSSNFPEYFKYPDTALGLETAPWRAANMRRWGKLKLIDFLIGLGEQWNLSSRTDAPPNILVGDISPEGGASAKRDPVTDHSSHKIGIDVDVFVFRQDGKAEKTDWGKKRVYDQSATFALIKLAISQASQKNLIISDFFFNDPDSWALAPIIRPWPNHDDHFHIRLAI
jgi:murein endopeptidase